MARVSTKRPPWLAECLDLSDWGSWSSAPRSDQANNDLEAAIYYGYDASGDLKTTAKTMTDAALHRTADEQSPCYSAAMTSIVAPCQTLPRRNHKTMTTATPRRALEDDVACKL